MTIKNKLILSIAFFLIYALIVNPVSGAFSYVEVDVPADINEDTAQNNYIELTSGKLLFVFYNYTNERLFIQQFSSIGVLEQANNVINNPSDSPNHQDSIRIKIHEVNATHSIIFWTWSKEAGSYSTAYANSIFWNCETKTASSVAYVQVYTKADGGNHDPYYASTIYSCEYDSDYYFMYFTTSGSQVDKQLFFICKVTPANILTEQHEADFGSDTKSGKHPPLYGYQHPNNTDQVYLVCSDPVADVYAPQFYRVDIDAPSIETLATGGTSYWSDDYRCNLLGSGIELNGTQYYLYFNLARPYLDGSTRRMYVYQYIMRFDNSITLANINATDILAFTVNPLLDTGVTVNWVIGQTTDYANFQIYIPAMSGGLHYCTEANFTITDFFDLSANSISWSGFETNTDIPVSGDTDFIAFNPNWSSLALYTETWGQAFIYYDLTPQGSAYDIALSWSPSHSPQRSYTQYAFTASCTLNGYVWLGSGVSVQLEGNQIYFGVPDSGGRVTFSYTFYYLSNYNMTISLFDPQIGLIYSEEFTLIVSDDQSPSTGEVPTVLTPNYVNTFTTLLPAFFVIGVPAFILGVAGQKSGFGFMAFIFGALLGAGVGFMAGVISPPVFYLLILFVAVMLVMIFKQRAGG